MVPSAFRLLSKEKSECRDSADGAQVVGGALHLDYHAAAVILGARLRIQLRCQRGTIVAAAGEYEPERKPSQASKGTHGRLLSLSSCGGKDRGLPPPYPSPDGMGQIACGHSTPAGGR